MPITGTLPIRSLACTSAPTTAAGSPGPFESTTPSGFRARISAAGVREGTTVPQEPDQPAGIDPFDSDHAVALEKLRQRLPRAPVGGLLADPPRDHPGRLSSLRLLVSEMDPVVSDLADGEGDELSGIGRIGEDL